MSEVKPHIDLVESWNNFFRAQLISIITFIMRAGKLFNALLKMTKKINTVVIWCPLWIVYRIGCRFWPGALQQDEKGPVCADCSDSTLSRRKYGWAPVSHTKPIGRFNFYLFCLMIFNWTSTNMVVEYSRQCIPSLYSDTLILQEDITHLLATYILFLMN